MNYDLKKIVVQLGADLKEALDLLQSSGPNSLIINEDEYWERFKYLMDKYTEDEDSEDEE